MVQSSLSARSFGFCTVDLELGGKQYSNIRLSILPGLCADLLLGLDFQQQHQSVIFHHGIPQPPLEVCGLSLLKVGSPELFANRLLTVTQLLQSRGGLVMMTESLLTLRLNVY